jgi:8-oxo-dGTP pyrophosphatase MutT (NUDIX family)
MILPKGSNPYTVLSHELLHERPFVRSYKDEVLMKGLKKDYSYLETDGSSGIVALNEKGEVALVGQWRYPVQDYHWEVPAGMAERGESPLENAKRELLEEAGVQALEWTALGALHMDGSKLAHTTHLFLAQNLTVGANAPMPDEELAVKWLPLETALLAVEKGEIQDGLTIIGLLKAQRILQGSGPKLP